MLANRIATWFVQTELIDTEEREWFKYAIEKRILTICSAAVFLIIGSAFAPFVVCCAFLFCFYFLRARTNGFHAETYLGCMLFSAVCEILLLCVIRPVVLLHLKETMFVSAVITLALAPVNDNRIHLSKEEIKACKKRAYFRVAVIVILAILTNRWDKDAATGIGLGCVMTALTLCLGHIKQILRKENGK